jgi:hypothetical protein
VFVVAGYNRVKAKWDGNNNTTKLDALPIVSHEFVKVAPRHFISDVLKVYQPCLDCF